MTDYSLNLQDYLDATSDSSRRTRTIVISLVVACVLALAGLLNSLSGSWMLARVQAFSDPKSQYVVDKLGFSPQDEKDERYQEFYTAVVRSYVENAFTIRVPFFGFTFDVNDLGLLAGISFIVILVLLRFSLRSEIVSLRLSFNAVSGQNKATLAIFYDLLAMRQVLTMPHVEIDADNWIARRPRILKVIGKSMCFLPVLIYTIVMIHDFMTIEIGHILKHGRTQILIAYTLCFWLIIVLLALWCFRRWGEIDRLWEKYWNDVRASQQTGGTLP